MMALMTVFGSSPVVALYRTFIVVTIIAVIITLTLIVVVIIIMIIMFHHQHAVHRCSLLLQMLHVV